MVKTAVSRAHAVMSAQDGTGASGSGTGAGWMLLAVQRVAMRAAVWATVLSKSFAASRSSVASGADPMCSIDSSIAIRGSRLVSLRSAVTRANAAPSASTTPGVVELSSAWAAVSRTM